MALSPLRSREERFVEIKREPSPTKTYEFDFDTGEFSTRLIDEDKALRQFIQKAIRTARYRFLIYNGQYGCELESLLGQDISHELLKSEITRLITEALIYDDRIQAVNQFIINRESDKLFVSFTVHSGGETIEQEVIL
jgi:phage baseplate assembly protein W